MGLISKTVKIKWYPTNREWYESKEYIFTKWHDEFEVKVEDLSNGSHACVDVRCNKCGEILKNIPWQNYLKCVKEDKKYYCNNCSHRLFSGENIRKSKLSQSESLGYWLIKNLSLREAINILTRWDYELNGCDIREVCYGSRGLNKELKGYWFKCPKHIHPSELKNIANFIVGKKGCLDCNTCQSFAKWGYDNIDNDFLSKYWDWEKNEELGIDPWKISYGSNKKVWIKCIKHSYHGSYFIQCNAFYNNIRCGYCGNHKVHYLDSLGYLYPQVRPIWSEKNKKSPYDYTPNSGQEVWWKCSNNKHNDYYRIISESNSADFRCPECVQERTESVLQEKARLYLESLGYQVLHEHNCTLVPINPKKKGKNNTLPFDNEITLINGKHLICEVNGIQHYEELSKNHSWLNGVTPKEYLHYQQLKDRYKRFMAYKNHYEYLEIPYWTDNKNEIYKQLINDKIKQMLKK